jgi:ceramide glucosyltransferase
VLNDHPEYDAKLYLEEEDPRLQPGHLGPNPKIRNMSRAYREAKGDLVWIIDCNVWVNTGACARMVDKLCGYTHDARQRTRPYKLVHHLPISVDVPFINLDPSASHTAESISHDSPTTLPPSSPSALSTDNAFGGRLEELFLASSHAKMYVAINMVAIAPCIVGKSTMFRRSQLNALTHDDGIDHFSQNICEDHLVGDLLWKSAFWASRDAAGWVKFRNHGLVLGDLAIQPVAGMSVANYIARRVRWLRVRKFTVPAATLVEPGTESILCSAMGAWGITTSRYTKEWAVALAGGEAWAGWRPMLVWMLGSIVVWSVFDWTNHLLLHSGATIEQTGNSIPAFARPPSDDSGTMFRSRRKWRDWAKAWLGREVLALPIWSWAIWGGVSVTWREKRFWVGYDMKVHEIRDEAEVNLGEKLETNGHVLTPAANGNAQQGRRRKSTRR